MRYGSPSAVLLVQGGDGSSSAASARLPYGVAENAATFFSVG